MTTELFSANRATTTVSSGGTDAPSGGTVQTWTVASSAMFGAAATGVSQFHVADPAAPSEIIAVTNVSGTTWTVTRGAEGTAPVTHTAGFTIYQIVTAGFLNSILPSQVVAQATGTAATDEANIAAAVTAAGVSGTVFFPPGTYIADGLAPLSGQTWYGPATIKRPDSSTASVVTATGLTGFTMTGLTIDGNQSGSSATVNAAVYLINSAWCRLQGITVQNTPSANAAIIMRGAVRCIIDGCQVSSAGYGILLGLLHGDAYACYGNIIRGCTIDTTVLDAIFLSENLGSVGSISVTGSVAGTVVSGCVVRNFGDCGIEIGSGTVYTEVTGCTFDGISNGNGNNGILFRDSMHGNATGCTVSNLTKTGSTGVYMFNLNSSNQHNSINNVDIYNVGYGYNINGSTTGGTVGTAAVDIAINGGIIDTTALDGIHLSNVNGFSITGTQVHDAGGQGISVGGFSLAGSGCTDGTITGCRVFNSSQIASGDSGVILFQATADVTITGCRIGDNQGAGATQKYGIRVFDSTVTNVNVLGNDLTGNVTAAFISASSVANGVLYAPKVLIPQAEPAAFRPSDPSSTASTSLVMMGTGVTCVYVPAGSGKVLANVTAMLLNATATTNMSTGACYAALASASATTVASGSNGGEISQVASWSAPSAGVLDVASTAGWATSGTLWVAASGSTFGQVTYAGVTGTSFTGCAYVTGSATGTVSTSGAVTAYPPNGAAQAGTLFGGNAFNAVHINGTSAGTPVAWTDVLALTPGTVYWFDVAVSTASGADAAVVKNISMTFAELP